MTGYRRVFAICLWLMIERNAMFAEASLHTEVTNWKKMYLLSDFCEKNDCRSRLKEAERAGSNFDSGMDTKAAVEMVFVYSDKDPGVCRVLNKVLLGTDTDSTPKDVEMFLQYASILKTSIKHLCQQFPEECRINFPVFRGMINSDNLITMDTTKFTFENFVSTSKWINKSQDYFKGGASRLMFHIKHVDGIYIKRFSAYPYQFEVTIPPPATFLILNVTTDQSAIQRYMALYGGSFDKDQPTKFVHAEMIEHKGNESGDLRFSSFDMFWIVNLAVFVQVSIFYI